MEVKESWKGRDRAEGSHRLISFEPAALSETRSLDMLGLEVSRYDAYPPT